MRFFARGSPVLLVLVAVLVVLLMPFTLLDRDDSPPHKATSALMSDQADAVLVATAALPVIQMRETLADYVLNDRHGTTRLARFVQTIPTPAASTGSTAAARGNAVTDFLTVRHGTGATARS